MSVLTDDYADRILGILRTHCGANLRGDEWNFRRFVEGALGNAFNDEYRFIGSLGFGGKVWIERRAWRVSCYPEDETGERREAIATANAELAKLHSEYREIGA